ncbi:hypothetical protein E7747_04565 [Duncaniella dubosii]|uniref:Uncharacterized protein n=1 Tax=Duncaniella dubosii TaxID=2518971 RepID=A0A4P7W2K0_9BACT|nr:ribonuclease P protein component [Duncaniella dubosii]QCD41620.1 hypothetical protein E7747_04565 [Duncaniella dubosii]
MDCQLIAACRYGDIFGDIPPQGCPVSPVSRLYPKKKLRHAVDRVQMRRRVREAYRLNRHLIPKDIPLDIAFIYVATEVLPYAEVLKGVTRILTRISKTLSDQP